MGNVIGKVFDDYVNDQIKIRQKTLSKLDRSDKELQLLNNSGAFLRLASAVDISKKVADRLGYSNLSGKKLAKKLVLWNGVTSIDIENDGTAEDERTFNDINLKYNPPKQGIGNGGLNNAYGFAGTEMGYRPMPVLEGASTSFYNNGSLQKVDIKIKAFNLQQLELIDTLYMKLGYTILLEWGHVFLQYNDGDIRTFDAFNTKPLNQLFQPISYYHRDESKQGSNIEYGKMVADIYKGKAEAVNQYSMYEAIKAEREFYSGNYDAFYGKVTNFSWTFNTDGTYSITINAISLGDIIESLKANKNISTEIDLKENETPEEKKKEKPILIANKDRSDIDTWLYNVMEYIDKNGKDVESSYTLKYAYPLDNLMNWITGTENATQSKTIKFKNKVTDPLIIYDSPYDIVENENWKITDSDAQNKKGYANYKVLEPYVSLNFKGNSNRLQKINQYYVKFGLFLRFLEKSINLWDGNTPNIKFDWDFNRNYCLTFPEQNSADPRICIIPMVCPEREIKVENMNEEQKKRILEIYENNKEKKAKREVDNAPNIGTSTKSFVYKNSWNVNNKVCGTQFNGNYASFAGKDETYNNPYVGRLMHIHVNLEFISKTLQESADKEGNISLFDLLENILKGISKSLGGVNNFSVGYDSDRNSLVIRENSPLRYDNIPGAERTKVSPVEFQSYGIGNNIGGSFLYNIGFNVKVPNNMATLVTVGAQSNSNEPGENATAFSLLNSGHKDRIIPKKNTTSHSDKEKNSQEPEKSPEFKQLLTLIKMMSLIQYVYTRRNLEGDDISTYVELNKEYSNYIVGEMSNQNQIPPPFFLPFDLQLEMKGLSGMKIFEKLRLNEKILPSMYGSRANQVIEFLIKGISHDIQGNKWTTKLETLSAPILPGGYSNFPENKPTKQEKKTEKTNEVVSNPQNPAWEFEDDPSLDALYPPLKGKIEDIIAELEKEGFKPRIVTGFRSRKTQFLKKQQGFSTVDYSYHNVVTGTKGSPKKASLAVDMIDSRYGWGEEKSGRLLLNSSKTKGAANFFKRLGAISKKYNLTWGGDWFGLSTDWKNFGIGWDPAHVELRKDGGQLVKKEGKKIYGNIA